MIGYIKTPQDSLVKTDAEKADAFFLDIHK